MKWNSWPINSQMNSPNKAMKNRPQKTWAGLAIACLLLLR
ncbi:hypothetical protein MDMS009_2770 [Methylophaga thiooxydans DMS010]|uniref:Uncharacterized protein n=1 Tax=Methylophaga thiooxydans DMS010 TaxID=637616 RepID=C0N9D6_9GAMM|nr:hypothetical protein MDMS009_2770 [Methylophaga thiooxydans DMS010]